MRRYLAGMTKGGVSDKKLCGDNITLNPIVLGNEVLLAAVKAAAVATGMGQQ